MRERPQAVDARVRPEVDQHDLAAQLPSVSGLPPGVFIHSLDAGEVRRRGPLASGAAQRLAAAAQVGELLARDELSSIVLLQRLV